MMTKWMNHILDAGDPGPAGDHLTAEEVARLADGTMPEPRRQECILHLNRCRDCFDWFDHVLADVHAHSAAETRKEKKTPLSMPYALAASIVFLVCISGALFFHFTRSQNQVLLASITLDQSLRDLLMENENTQWEKKDRVDRLAALLRDRGVKVPPLKGVLLASVYYPSKSLFGPEEILVIRIENGVARLSVREKKPQTR